MTRSYCGKQQQLNLWVVHILTPKENSFFEEFSKYSAFIFTQLIAGSELEVETPEHMVRSWYLGL